MKVKREFCITVLVLIVLLAAACGPAAAPTEAPAAPAPTDEPAAVPTEAEAEVAPTEAEPEPTEPPPTEAAEEPTDEEPVIMRVGTVIDLDCLNPFACSWWWWYEDYIYEGFVGPGPNCERIPRLAESMEVSEDGLTWTLHLQEGVTYGDGEPFNAYTLADHWDWYTSVEPGSWYAPSRESVSWEAVDEHTFQFTTALPIGSWPEYDGVWQWPYPTHIWGELDDETIWDFENYPPIGTGPYTMTEWEPGQYVIFDAREDYWGGKPPIDRVVVQLFANWDAMILALQAGEIDLTDNPIPVQYYDTLAEGDPNVTVVSRPHGYHYGISFNMMEGGAKHPAIEDLVVRKAIDYAVDREHLIELALGEHGFTCPNDWFCGPLLEQWHDPSLVVTPHDPGEANRLLDEAGYLDGDDDGIRETPDGEPLSLRLFYDNAVPTEDTMAGMITDQLAQVGIEALPESFELGTLYNAVLGLRDYDMSLIYISSDSHPASLDFFYSCYTAEAGEGAYNYPGYCNPELDDLIYQVIETVDEEEQQQVSFAASRILYDDIPFLMLAGERASQAYRSDRFDFVDDYCPLAMGMWDWYSTMNVEIIE